METERLSLSPTTIAEWNDTSGDFFDVLSSTSDAATSLDDTAARALLDEMSIELPRALDWRSLLDDARSKLSDASSKLDNASLKLDDASSNTSVLEAQAQPLRRESYDYYFVEIPLSFIIPLGSKLVRLRLELDLSTPSETDDEIVAYDLFPTTAYETTTLMSGQASLDISQAFEFIFAATGQLALVPATKCLGLKLDLPFKWTSTTAVLQSSARMSNPVRWSLLDVAIEKGFVPQVIVRAPKSLPITVKALLVGEIRQSQPFGFAKTQFTTPQRTYQIGIDKGL